MLDSNGNRVTPIGPLQDGNLQNAASMWAQQQAQEKTDVQSLCGQSARRSTLVEDAERALGHHAEAHAKAAAAYEFLTRHPEFDEFVRLIRSGSIQI